MAKRMNSIVMVEVLVIRRASPSASALWSRSPTPRLRNVSAVRQLVARVVPRVRLRSRAALEATAAAQRREGCRRKDDDEQGREDAADGRQDDEDRGARGLLLRALTALHAHLLGLDPQDLRHRHTELIGLDDRGDEAAKLFLLDAVIDAAKGL